MLSSTNRLTSPEHFREVVRRGRRRGGPLVVVHLWTPPLESRQAVMSTAPRVGFVVSRAVGPAVTRNLVKRRLRHLARARVGALPAGSMLVVRALPASASADQGELARELDRCLREVGVEGVTGDVPVEAVVSG